jgi:hypothetical protein
LPAVYALLKWPYRGTEDRSVRQVALEVLRQMKLAHAISDVGVAPN